MKKRWAMGLLCCLLLFQLAFPAKAAGSVYFVAAEESVLPVTDATMPFWANGYLYVPASVFTNLGISVTDPDLIAATGGIVQGMSGSPILQNGKLVGAVTHVLLSDATKGYGISMETMLNAGENV